MSHRTADAAVGMMDAAYFIGRKELLDFFNDLLELKLTKIEQTATGAIACQITDLIFPGSIPLSKIDWSAKSDYEFVQNYKLLQNAFNKHRVQRHVDVDKLIRAKYQDNLEFCQWLKAFYDQSGVIRENYDPSAARAKGKGGKQYNQLMGKSSSTSASSRPRPTSAVSRPATTSTTTTARSNPPVSRTTVSKPSNNTVTATPPSPIRTTRPLRETNVSSTNNRTNTSNHSTNNSNSNQQAVADAILIKKNAELKSKNEELEQAVLEIEKERDFYFEKLRNVEVMLQIYQEKDTATRNSELLIDNVFKILYATADDNLIVNEDGDAVPNTEESLLLNETARSMNGTGDDSLLVSNQEDDDRSKNDSVFSDCLA